MSRRKITITYSDKMFDSSEKRASVNTVLDAFGCICGFYADDILFVKEQSKKAYSNNSISLPEQANHSNDYFIISLQAISKAEETNSLNNSLDNKSGYPPDNNVDMDFLQLDSSEDEEKNNSDPLLGTLQKIFTRLITKLPQLKRVIDFFLNNRLWEFAILSQTYSNNSNAKGFVANKCNDIVDGAEITEADKNDTHFIYTILYLKYLNLFLSNNDYSLNNKFGSSTTKDLRDLFDETIQFYQKTNSAVFVKLSGMVLAEMGNLDYSEKMYNRYIGLILKEGNVIREIGKAFYDLGHIYENYSRRGSYTLSTIYQASNYYDMAYEYDQGNYRAWYKKALPPHMNKISSDNIEALMRLRNALDQIVEEGSETLRAHLYRYKITNHLLVYSINTWQNSENNQKYVDELENEYSQIELIWKYLCPNYVGDLWLNELKRYLNSRIREVADLLLTLRSNGINEDFLRKRSQIQKTEISENDNSRLEAVGALS